MNIGDLGDILSFFSSGHGMYSRGFIEYDYTYVLVVISIIISTISRLWLSGTYNKYSGIRTMHGITGRQTAEMIMDYTSIYGIGISIAPNKLGDNYNPSNKTLNLSLDVHDKTSIASVAIAAHECGHMIQDNEGYSPLRFRQAIFPLTNICSKISMPAIVLGFILGMANLIEVGILLFCVALFFQLVTLPVEFNASRRAMNMINTLQILTDEEKRGASKVLTAAAFTYVAGVIVSALTILRFILILRRR